MEIFVEVVLTALLGFLILQNVKGQYDIQLIDFVTFPPNVSILYDASKIKVKRFQRGQPHVMHGPLEVLKDMGNEITMIGELFKKQGYEYRKTAYKTNDHFCDMFKKGKFLLNQMMIYTDIPSDPFPCPLPVGTYHLNYLYLNFTGLPPVGESGDFMARASYYVDGKFLQGVEVYVNVVNLLGTLKLN